jgi:hypothetical protein
MMEQQNVAPVNHGVLSATGNVALGTVGGGIKYMAKTVLWCVGIGAVIGVLAATGVLPLAAVTTGTVAGTFWSTIGNVVLGGSIGGLVGAAASTLVAPIAGLVGAGKGAVHSTNRVSQEKGAAKAIEAQVAVYQAQAQAEAMAASNDNKYQFPPQGSPMNQAGSTVNAMQADGRVDGMQLQRA